MKISMHAHAKINWSLAICSERPDGYHDLDMLMQTIGLCDELSFENARWLTLSVNGQRLPVDSRNLVVRAANALNDVLGTHHGARITLKKNIPSRAGMGGGSADCAATLIALNKLWDLKLPLRTLVKIGLQLGADVPFCLTGGLCRAEGVGEIRTPLTPPSEIPLVLNTPGGGLSTPAVFKAWNAGKHTCAGIDNHALADALAAGDLLRADKLARNDLEVAAIQLMPEIAALMQHYRDLGAQFVRMSGSGSTVFAAFACMEAAQAAAQAVPGSIVTTTLAQQSGL